MIVKYFHSWLPISETNTPTRKRNQKAWKLNELTFHRIQVLSSFRTSSSNKHPVLISSIFRVEAQVLGRVYQVLALKFSWISSLIAFTSPKTQIIDLEFDQA